MMTMLRTLVFGEQLLEKAFANSYKSGNHQAENSVSYSMYKVCEKGFLRISIKRGTLWRVIEGNWSYFQTPPPFPPKKVLCGFRAP